MSTNDGGGPPDSTGGGPPDSTGGGPPDSTGGGPPDSTGGGPQDGAPEPGSSSGQQTPPRRGNVSRQEPGTTQPRPPTVGEVRARKQARKQAAELEAAARAAEERRRKRNRRLIGGAAVVGVVAVVAVGYKVLSAHENVTARCVVMEDGSEVVVEDRYCNGSPGMNGIFIVGGSQYRYYYGGNGTIGQSPTGGSTVKPKGAEIKTSSGTTVQRGGLGAKVGGSSGS
ncbi:hypothetical protein OG921_23615 [Aldersonia sp. NBC_00410]|uniref:hypothetical protein n=1 Tax=Aldersonia sp. NBC_00410 TaxID=2975954 RepID=UPI0022562DBE|nr:hypothetical protein [Aldersonia sp. NBC_00410]MCX5046162.1 hypothetical protein [Aldersonia sp. NBC_00410]